MDPGKVGQMNKYIKDGNWRLKYLLFTEYVGNDDNWYYVRSDDSLVWIYSFNFHRKQPQWSSWLWANRLGENQSDCAFSCLEISLNEI